MAKKKMAKKARSRVKGPDAVEQCAGLPAGAWLVIDPGVTHCGWAICDFMERQPIVAGGIKNVVATIYSTRLNVISDYFCNRICSEDPLIRAIIIENSFKDGHKLILYKRHGESGQVGKALNIGKGMQTVGVFVGLGKALGIPCIEVHPDEYNPEHMSKERLKHEMCVKHRLIKTYGQDFYDAVYIADWANRMRRTFGERAR